MAFKTDQPDAQDRPYQGNVQGEFVFCCRNIDGMGNKIKGKETADIRDESQTRLRTLPSKKMILSRR